MRNRRTFLEMLGCSALVPVVQALPALPAKSEIIVDYRGRFPGEMEERMRGGHVFVDGKEIRQVFYVNTGRRLVMSYDVLEDGKAYCGWAKIDWPRGTFTTPHGPAFKEIRGSIQLFTRYGARLA